VRVFGHFVSVDSFGLWLADTILFVMLVYVVAMLGMEVSGVSMIASHSKSLDLVRIVPVSAFSAALIGLYQPKAHISFREIFAGVASAMFVGYLVFVAASLAFHSGVADFLVSHERFLFSLLVLWTLSLALTRISFFAITQSGLIQRKIVILGSTTSWTRFEGQAEPALKSLFRVAAMVNFASGRPTEPSILKKQGIWAAIVTPDGRSNLDANYLMKCRSVGIRIFNEVEFRERHLKRVDIDRLCAGWLAYVDKFSSDGFDNVIRRGFDIFCSLVLLVITAPLMLITSILIKLDSSGPVFYHQKRIGLLGVPFMIIKFRSMRVDAEASGAPRWASLQDPRVTRIGSFLRLVRIDELPQLFNVLRGEMSLIGPRPERPEFVDQLNLVIPHYHDRSFVKPGITGWAQINFPYGASIEDARMKLSYDLYYLKHRSLFLDLVILASTIRVVLFQEGSR
jgi:sugar transferase (PEP-CTERM system associated)